MGMHVLEGLKIIELATYIAAPGAAGIMTDWGAEVIKIEQPGGDPIRKFFDSIGSDLSWIIAARNQSYWIYPSPLDAMC
jgi:crotonobetainyl-CoA:carnitine CoA-transferase CaiB-like acyl-CoA transferase